MSHHDRVTLHVFASDFQAEESRCLLDWCLSHGADSFSVIAVRGSAEPDRFGADFEARLAAYEVPADGVEGIAAGEPGPGWTRPTILWRLTRDSAEILWEALSFGLLSYSPGAEGWLEDPVLYRGSELLLGIVSHEGEGVLRVSTEEEAQLDRASIPYRRSGQWVDY